MRYLLNCFIIAMVLILSLNFSQAQNPFIKHMYTADPSAHVWKVGPGRLTKLGSMKSIPDWVQNGGKSPVGRTTFIPYWFYAGTESLFESGLIGPVQLLY